jgi:polyisoprenoid-binding protein YceI
VTTELSSASFFRTAFLGIAMFVAPAAIHAARAQAYMSESGYAEFTSSLPAVTFSGKSHTLTGRIDLDEGIVDFYLDLTTLDTGIGKRDKDMRETLETDEYPFAEFYGTLDSAIDPELHESQSATVSGTFTVHGVSRQVVIEGTLTPTDEGLHVEAEWELNLEDYEIEPPRLLILKVDEVQEIRIDTMLTPEDS